MKTATISFDVFGEDEAAALMGFHEMMQAGSEGGSEICDAKALWLIAMAMQWDVNKLPRFGGGDAFMAVSDILWLREAAARFDKTAQKLRDYVDLLVDDDEELLQIVDRVRAIDREFWNTAEE